LLSVATLNRRAVPFLENTWDCKKSGLGKDADLVVKETCSVYKACLYCWNGQFLLMKLSAFTGRI
jgi:hypothetical protein